MKFGPVPLADALGAVLAHSVATPSGRLRKGQVIDAAALDQLAEDLDQLMVSANAVLDTPGARALPEDLGNALNELQAVLAELREGTPAELAPEAPLSILIPSFLLSEIERAFQIGFLIFLPFLIIDLVVAAVLMSMGMMMVPPAIVSLPFKLAFFVVADGWSLLAGSLVRSYF